MLAKHVAVLMTSYKKKNTNKSDELWFIKPGQYMSATDNRFVTLKNIEPCLLLEDGSMDSSDPRYIVFVNNEHLIARADNVIQTGETYETICT